VVVAIAMMQLHTQREYIRKKERAWLERESECALGFGAILLVLTHSGLCNATQRNGGSVSWTACPLLSKLGHVIY
jgi:hypothetical protein